MRSRCGRTAIGHGAWNQGQAGCRQSFEAVNAVLVETPGKRPLELSLFAPARYADEHEDRATDLDEFGRGLVEEAGRTLAKTEYLRAVRPFSHFTRELELC